MSMLKQRGDSDCVLACLCMATGCDYTKSFSKAFRSEVEKAGGCYDKTLEKAFSFAGLSRDEYSCIYTELVPLEKLKQLLWGRKCILQVASLNYEGGQHCVYYDGENLFDPSNKQVYKWLSSCSPTHVWIFK